MALYLVLAHMLKADELLFLKNHGFIFLNY